MQHYTQRHNITTVQKVIEITSYIVFYFYFKSVIFLYLLKSNE